MKSILVANLAGGVGKSITVQSLAAAMTEYGKKVLAIDADPGAFLTFLSGVENPRFTSRELFAGESNVEITAVRSYDRFSLIPSSSRLVNWPSTINPKLREELTEFDVVIFDSPTGPSSILPTLIEHADLVIAPIMRDLHSIRGLLNLRDFLSGQESKLKINVLDIAKTPWDLELRELVAEEFSFIEPSISPVGPLFSQSSGASVLSESPKSDVSAEYREVAYSLLEELGLF